jgi:hypothetical protein
LTAKKHEFENDVKLDVEARVRQSVKAVLEEVLEEEMTQRLEAGYRELTPTRRGEPPRGIHTLPEYATGAAGVGIPDPYGLTMAAYRNTLRQLYEYVEHVGDRLEG